MIYPYRIHLNESIETPKKWHEIFVSKKSNNINQALQEDLTKNLWIKWINSLQVFSNYVVDWLENSDFENSIYKIFAEAPVDNVYSNEDFYKLAEWKKVLVIESKPGQFDPRVEAIKDNINLVTWKISKNRYKHVIVFDWEISKEDLQKIKDYLINPNEKFESNLEDKKLEREVQEPKNHVVLEWFIDLKTNEDLKNFLEKHNISIEFEDIKLVQDYFKNEEKRDPTKVELLLIGTYWSDHCRHTTFETQIENVEFSGDSNLIEEVKKTEKWYKEKSKEKWKTWNTFMQIATSSLRFLKDDPDFEWLENIDYSEEDNAASYKCKIELENWKIEDWIIMFKNETHNSPTEAEPFWGAATCIWWAIRDTLSGRSFTFAAMRISWAWNPTEFVSKTIKNKVSQRAISIWAALGYASYGNQIGLATTKVREFFHPWYKAKRFELGYVLWWVKEENLDRRIPKAWDLIIMAWWPTWRDWIGWATTSSKDAWVMGKEQEWAHVQKWNPVEERKFQRLSLDPEFTKKIVKSNDFGAWWVSVALWELARWVKIDLNKVAQHVKYSWLSDEELTISESQERMSYIIQAEDKDGVLKMFEEKNIKAFVVWEITTDKENKENDRLIIEYQWKNVVDISRNFLDKNWIQRKHNAKVIMKKPTFFEKIDKKVKKYIEEWNFVEAVKLQLSFLNNSSQKWLQEGFDSSVWASTILAPYGWKYQSSPQIASVNKIPHFDGVDSKTAIISTHWFNPYLLEENTYIGGMYAIIEAISSIVAVWWSYKKAWLSLQEYFGSLTNNEKYWEVYVGLLWTLKALIELKVATIGWKDSMSWTYKCKDWSCEINVPPSIVAFANTPVDSKKVVSAEFKEAWNKVVCLKIKKNTNWLPDFDQYKDILTKVQLLIDAWAVKSSSVVWSWWIIEAITKLSLWNKIWFKFEQFGEDDFKGNIWDIILEIDKNYDKNWLAFIQKNIIWETINKKEISFNWWWKILIDNAQNILEWTLDWLWSTNKWEWKVGKIQLFIAKNKKEIAEVVKEQPLALIPIFPWTNSELDTKNALLKAWFVVEEYVFNTLTPEKFKKSREKFVKKLKNTDMLVVPWGFSWWDEPWVSWIWAVNVFKSKEIRDSLQEFFDKKDTLAIWICNWAQILNKLWVLDFGKIKDILTEDDTIITHNDRLNHETWLVRNKVLSTLSPFIREDNLWEEYLLNISHGEWKFKITKKKFEEYFKNGQILMQYQDEEWNPTNKYNGSSVWIAAMTSNDWRILVTMPHIERVWLEVAKNIPWEKLLPMFENAYKYFRRIK